MKEALCRPDETHWCIECCIPSCILLGDVGVGKMGCLGHNCEKTTGSLPKRDVCLNFDCLDDRFLPEDREEIRQIISGMPAGKFRMKEALIKFKAEKGGN